MESYRVIILFDADSVDQAHDRAAKAARAAKGDVDRLTQRKETWVGVEVPTAPAPTNENDQSTA